MIQNIKHEVWISATTVVLGLYGFAHFVAIFPLALKLPSWKRVDQQLTSSKFVCKGWTRLLRRVPLCSNITIISAARDQSNSLNSAIWLARGTGGIFPSGPARFGSIGSAGQMATILSIDLSMHQATFTTHWHCWKEWHGTSFHDKITLTYWKLTKVWFQGSKFSWYLYGWGKLCAHATSKGCTFVGHIFNTCITNFMNVWIIKIVHRIVKNYSIPWAEMQRVFPTKLTELNNF